MKRIPGATVHVAGLVGPGKQRRSTPRNLKPENTRRRSSRCKMRSAGAMSSAHRKRCGVSQVCGLSRWTAAEQAVSRHVVHVRHTWRTAGNDQITEWHLDSVQLKDSCGQHDLTDRTAVRIMRCSGSLLGLTLIRFLPVRIVAVRMMTVPMMAAMGVSVVPFRRRFCLRLARARRMRMVTAYMQQLRGWQHEQLQQNDTCCEG